MSKKNLIVGEDMICPITKKHCDDECCPVGSKCNMGGDEISDITNTPSNNESLPNLSLMTKTAKIIIAVLCWVFFSYLWIAFIQAELNPFVWNSMFRSTMMFLVVTGGTSIVALIDVLHKPKSNE